MSAQVDPEIVRRKFADYGTEDVERKAREKLGKLAEPRTSDLFVQEMQRFLPAKRVREMTAANLHHAILADSAKLITDAVIR